MEATVSGGTVNGGSKSYNINVKPAKTAAEIKAEEEAAKKKEEERKAQEEANKKALEEATKLVESAEKSLKIDNVLLRINLSFFSFSSFNLINLKKLRFYILIQPIL